MKVSEGGTNTLVAAEKDVELPDTSDDELSVLVNVPVALIVLVKNTVLSSSELVEGVYG